MWEQFQRNTITIAVLSGYITTWKKKQAESQHFERRVFAQNVEFLSGFFQVVI
jgi:hypothetical protein